MTAPHICDPDPAPRAAWWAWAVAGVLLAVVALVWWFALEAAN